MPISHVSEVIKANPWIQPFSIDLMAKVNSYKQGQFYQNAAKIENMITQLDNADVANADQREYLKNKVNNLTTQVNNMGGINYSDMNIANTIEGYGAEIYGDEKVLNGIASTKSIREFEKNVQKMATDPKLSKYYNTSNITRIREQMINPYVNGGIDAKYTGPTAPRPYEGNPFEKLVKNMKVLPPDIGVNYTPSGDKFLYRISTKEQLKPEDINAAFDGLIDANTKAQLVDDAWYNFDYSTGYKFDKALGQKLYSDDLINKVNQYTKYIGAIDFELKTQIDGDERKRLENDKISYQKAIDTANREITTNNNSFSKLYDEDPASAKYGLYVGKLRDDVIKASGYSKEKVTYIKNEEALFQARKELEYIKLGLQLNSDGSVTKIPGVKTKGSAKGDEPVDPLTKFGDLAYSYRNNTETEAQAVNAETIEQKNNVLLAENNALANNFLQDFAQQNGFDQLLDYQLRVNTSGVGEPQTYQSDLINKIKGSDNMLTESDLAAVTNQARQIDIANIGLKQGKDANGNPIDYNITVGNNKFKVGFEQMKVLDQLRDAWQKFGTRQIDTLPDSMQSMKKEFVEFATKHQANELAIAENKAFVQKVTDTALLNASTLTAQEKQEYQKFVANPDLQGTTVETGSIYKDNYDVTYKEDPRWKYLQSKFSKRNYDKSIKGAYATASKTLNYYDIKLTDDPKKLPDGLINKIIEKGNLNVSTVTPTSIRRKDDGTGFQVTYQWGKEGKREFATQELTDAEAAAFGIKPVKNPALENIFAYGAVQSPEFFVYNTYIKKPIFYKILKTPSGFYSVINYDNKKVFLKMPGGGYSNTASDAEELLKNVASENYPSSDALIQAIQEQNQQHY